MPSILNEALEWLDRAEQAREVAGQLTDPHAIGSPEPPLHPPCFEGGNWPQKIEKEPDDFSKPFLSRTASTFLSHPQTKRRVPSRRQ